MKRVVCSWCGKVVSTKPGSGPDTHTKCDECVDGPENFEATADGGLVHKPVPKSTGSYLGVDV